MTKFYDCLSGMYIEHEFEFAKRKRAPEPEPRADAWAYLDWSKASNLRITHHTSDMPKPVTGRMRRAQIVGNRIVWD